MLAADCASPKCSFASAPVELELHGISDAEAARVVLDYIYGVGVDSVSCMDESAASQVRKLADAFGLPGLHNFAAIGQKSEPTASVHAAAKEARAQPANKRVRVRSAGG